MGQTLGTPTVLYHVARVKKNNDVGRSAKVMPWRRCSPPAWPDAQCVPPPPATRERWRKRDELSRPTRRPNQGCRCRSFNANGPSR